MPAPPRLDVVHTSPVVTTALRHELRSGATPVRVETTVHSWADFRREWDFAGDVVIVDALLDDHLPLPLKVRALRRLGSTAIILGQGRATPFARRCGAEGAGAWIEPTRGLAETARTIREAALGVVADHARIAPAEPPVAALTDRELQVLALHASTRGHSPAHLGRVLDLRTETVRSHLERGRARYRRAGVATHNRSGVRAALVRDGWILDPEAWSAAGRD